jgi:serine phosphatase RsbU (regulator of sigma subunit)
MPSNAILEEELLEQFSASLTPRETTVLQDVKEFVSWEVDHQGGKFELDALDDVVIRTYFVVCHTQGKASNALQRINTSLGCFFTWLGDNGLIKENPFGKVNLYQLLLSPLKNKPRHDAFPGLPNEREIARLRALNRLAESTNRASDVQSMLDSSLTTMLDEMNLHTAWISLKYDGGFIHQKVERPEHGFVLAAAQNLPPSLEQGDRLYLRRPPACNCQKLLDSGNLKRGVNIVECSRLQDAAKTSQENDGLQFHASVPIICNDQAMGVMNFAAKDWELLSASDLQFLTAGARQVGAALERARLYDQIHIQHTHLQHELSMARKVQVSMLPEKMPKIPGYSLAALWKPAYETSGDYYNIYKLPGGRWGFIVADVCDKGAPAALYMAMAHSLIRERVENETSPATLLTQVNKALCQQDIKTNFITSFYAILDPENATLKYALAGHPPPLLRKITGTVHVLDGKGVALGVFPDAQYKDVDLSLEPGQSVVAFTDGLTDANNRLSESFELEPLKEAVGMAPAAARPMLRHLQKRIDGWVKDTPNFDDITILVVGREPKPQSDHR